MFKKSILLLLLLPLLFYSQKNVTLSGYIDEAESGEKLIGCTVYDLKSGKGTVTNDYGWYSLTIPVDSIKIRVSYIGYGTQIYEDYLSFDIVKNFSLSDKMLEEKFTELNRKYWMTKNPQVQMQMSTLIEQMREEIKSRQALKKVQEEQDQGKKGLDNLINIS